MILGAIMNTVYTYRYGLKMNVSFFMCIINANTNPDVLDDLLGPVVPKTIVDPQLHELQWRLRAERILGWHVEVVHKGNH